MVQEDGSKSAKQLIIAATRADVRDIFENLTDVYGDDGRVRAAIGYHWDKKKVASFPVDTATQNVVAFNEQDTDAQYMIQTPGSVLGLNYGSKPNGTAFNIPGRGLPQWLQIATRVGRGGNIGLFTTLLDPEDLAERGFITALVDYLRRSKREHLVEPWMDAACLADKE